RDGGDESLVMSLSPMLGRVISLAFGDGDVDPREQEATVLVVPHPDHPISDPPAWLRPVSEADLLRAFWTLAGAADVVVTYNGRGFDIPFLIGRSLVHGISARVDLMGSPYSLRPHLDLYRVLTGGGRALGPTGLDVVCWALGIESPKGAMDGSKVSEAYARGEVRAIAEYNRGDIRATTEVYQRIRDRILSFREGW
ncbi:MAG: ribonuclease H-like domain-containing protein, partial [Myxococcales bacterium]|nr:ribonuclease H-like domain-containing protein [Myxococcales bacterium]